MGERTECRPVWRLTHQPQAGEATHPHGAQGHQQLHTSLYTQGADIPNLQSVQTNGVAWDWMKPCYHSTVSYQCDVENGLYDDEQEE